MVNTKCNVIQWLPRISYHIMSIYNYMLIGGVTQSVYRFRGKVMGGEVMGGGGGAR